MTTPPPEGPPPGRPADDPSDDAGSSAWQPSWQPQYPEQQYPPAQQGYGGPGYGAPPPGYGPPAGYGYAPPEHPKATTSMVLGILGVVVCQVIAPFAWAIGKKTVAEIDASGGQLGGRGHAQAGYILGIVGTVILGLSVVLLIVYFIMIAAIFGGVAASSP